MSLEQRVDRIEEAILVMKDLLVSQSGRLDDYYKALNESREDFEFKLNALIDAQIRNESDIDKLKESTTRLKESTTRLKESATELKETSIELRQASQSQ
jgi:hypothetical protein